MRIIESPDVDFSIAHVKNKKIFLAGGITNCPDWQAEFIHQLNFPMAAFTLYNPRRKSFDVSNPAESEKQIVWEHLMMEQSDIIVFWFSSGSLNPIALYELGKYIRSDKKIIIGIDPEYTRKNDIVIQTQLVTKYIDIYYSLDKLIDKILNIILDEVNDN